MNNVRNLTRLAAAVALLGTAAGTGLAQAAESGDASYWTGSNYNPSWYIAPSINGMDPDERFGTDKRGVGGGLRFGKPVSPDWDIQFGPTHSRVKDGAVRYRQTTLGVDALYMFSRERFRPFVLFGAGAQEDRVERPTPGSGHRTSPYVNVGLGFQYLFDEQWSMQADLRRSRGFPRGDDFNGIRRVDTNYLTLGLNYAFDKVARPVATRAVETPLPPPAPVVEAPRPPAPPPPKFERYTLSATELFEFNRAELGPNQSKLDQIADALNRNPDLNDIVISGYTDRLGTESYNLKLSQRRADAVKAYLVGRGVGANRLSAVGKGEANPVVECNQKQRAALIKCLEPNRRVEVEQIVIERRVQ